MARTRGKNAAVTIFEDVVEDAELVVDPAGLAINTLLAKPAQKIPAAIHHSPRREGLVEMRQQVLASSRAQVAQLGEEAKVLKRNPRRRTIFVPEDTTMMTIHPGAHATNLNDTFHIPNLPANILTPSQLAECIPMPNKSPVARRPRFSVAAKRAPLHHLRASPRDNNASVYVDRPGQGDGKENMLPAASLISKSGGEKKSARRLITQTVEAKPVVARSRIFEPTASSQARQTLMPRKAVPISKPRAMVKQEGSSPMQREPRPNMVMKARVPAEQNSRPANRPAYKKRFVAPTTTRLAQYPVLAEDIDQPQLYGSGCLTQDEIAFTELINEVYNTARPRQWKPTSTSLRTNLLAIYHRPEVTTLHNRIQASLEYGALSRPKEMPSPPDLTQDLGLRKRFLRLWLQNYEKDALQSVAEVIVGRQVQNTRSSSCTESEGPSIDDSRGNRGVLGFLETFFVTVEDLDNKRSSGGDDSSVSRRWQKTILRSLMLIWALDQAKLTGGIAGRLFKRTAAQKSSSGVLHALSGLLVPSVGDITRTLRHFEYSLEHNQDPLDEVDYQIKNIAVDLRNGIYLTKLVELLLFCSDNEKSKQDDFADPTVTLHLPDQTVVESVHFADGSLNSNILSQHLKMPCLGRAQKVFNVQVALTAVFEYGGYGFDDMPDIATGDIVDGHREKTLALLWALIGRHGLTKLIDWKALVQDTQRRTRESVVLEDDGTQTRQEELLRLWAAAHCRRYSDVQVRNLTTSFADGKVYAAVLESFTGDSFTGGLAPSDASDTPRLSSAADSSPAISSCSSLGFSQSSICHLTSLSATIPTRATTISNLALLASRLLPLAREHNAACILQRAIRNRQARMAMTRRITLVRLAHACATVARTQQRLVQAARVLQRSWRSVLANRSTKRGREVQVFQSMARGWAVRRRARKASVVTHQSLRSVRVW
ncbi:hypothetical protein LTR62_002568 [Meristemomyces frigidus]|uniref:Calponin-homology (CH) domain-containing protein n=1 Tax=Meristemomyces frigidus TaxID=1508187 RepID=A0AAN7TR27_9PEZI|nr:hypothetical protein LTR62_002568 [Meristemomyces frigidus]